MRKWECGSGNGEFGSRKWECGSRKKRRCEDEKMRRSEGWVEVGKKEGVKMRRSEGWVEVGMIKLVSW
jgi:hypothetical protein